MSHNNQRKVIHSIRTQVDAFGRKKYKLQEVVNSASEEEQNPNNHIIDTGRHKSMLIARDQGLNIDKYIGKIQTNKKKKTTEVFYCDVCTEGFKCDMAYLTHLNSPAHNRKLGMNMKVKNVSIETVSSKISSLINKKNKKADEQQQRLGMKSMEGSQNQQIRSQVKKRPPPTPPVLKEQDGKSEDQNQLSEDDQDHDDQDQDGNKKQYDVKQKQKQQDQQQQQEDQQNSNELAQMEMMKQMGFANSFANKKHKR